MHSNYFGALILQIIFSVIAVLATARPNDIGVEDAATAEADTGEYVSEESVEHDDVYTPIEILTNYPDDELLDKMRIRRKINNTYSSKEMDKQNTEIPSKVPLNGIIAAIESDLVTTALSASTQKHKRTAQNYTYTDANLNLFEDLFNFTRAERQTTNNGKDVKIPLNGLVNAVENTLINSAQNLRSNSPSQSHFISKPETNSSCNGTHRIDRDTNDASVQVQTLEGNKSVRNLNILSPIAFISVHNESEMDTTTLDVDDDDIDTAFTTEYPHTQRTNFTVIQASDTVSLVSDPDDFNKLSHVQHQAISQTVFQSNLAIFPTIAPTSLGAFLSPITSAEPTSKERMNENSTLASVQSSSDENEQNAKHAERMQKTLDLKEKFAEIEAQPIIFSQFP